MTLILQLLEQSRSSIRSETWQRNLSILSISSSSRFLIKLDKFTSKKYYCTTATNKNCMSLYSLDAEAIFPEFSRYSDYYLPVLLNDCFVVSFVFNWSWISIFWIILLIELMLWNRYLCQFLLLIMQHGVKLGISY